MDSLEEMDRFLEKFNLPRLSQEETLIMSNPIISTEIEAVIKNLPKNKSPGPNGFTREFYQTFSKELMPMLLKLFQKIAEEETLPNSFCEATITLISNPGFSSFFFHIKSSHPAYVMRWSVLICCMSLVSSSRLPSVLVF